MGQLYTRLGRLLLSAAAACVALGMSGCSVPKLETAECSAARDVVKRFYSFHFANDMQPSEENLQQRASYLTEHLTEELRSAADERKDPFTQADNFPRAFRVGKCVSESTDKAVLEVVLLWRDDTRNEQTEVEVEVVRSGDQWLIDAIR